MLRMSIVFLVIAIVASLLHVGGVADLSMNIAYVLFVVFLILFVLSFVLGGTRGGPPAV